MIAQENNQKRGVEVILCEVFFYINSAFNEAVEKQFSLNFLVNYDSVLQQNEDECESILP